jgi:hypothetical protein
VKLGKRYDSWKKKKPNRKYSLDFEKYYPGGKGEITYCHFKESIM